MDTMCMDGAEEFALEVVDIIRDGKYYDPEVPILPESEDFMLEYAIFLQGLEEELGVKIPDEIADDFCSLGDVVEFVKRELERPECDD